MSADVDARVLALLERSAPSEAAELVVRELGPELLGYLGAVLRNDADAHEAFAELSAQLVSSVERFRGEGTIKAFAYRIAWRVAMRSRHTPHRRREVHMPTGLESEIGEENVSSAAYRRTDAKTWLEAMRCSLSPEEQSLLVLRVDRGLSWDEIAAAMDLGNAVALRKRFERLRERLRQAADRDGLLG
jgi:RNA polymerase sigma-70 factor, ECF subfamily